MVHCVVKGCYNSTDNSNTSFFKFPKYKRTWKTNRVEMNIEWVVKINRVDPNSASRENSWQPDRNSHVCSDHFTKECFTRDPDLAKASGFKQMRLKDARHVVPTLIPTRDQNNRLQPVLEMPNKPAFTKLQHQNILKEILENDGQPWPTVRDVAIDGEPEVRENDPEPPSTTEHQQTACDQGTQTLNSAKPKTYVKRTQTERNTTTNGTQTNPLPLKFCSVATMTDNLVSTATDHDVNKKDFHCACCSRHTSAEADCVNEEETSDINDEDWNPTPDLPSDDESEEPNFDNCPEEIDITHVEDEDPVSERKYVIFESCLKELLSCCRTCNAECSVFIKRHIGTMVTLESRCQAGHVYTWSSQPERSRLPVGNLLLCGAILYSGSCVIDILNIFKHLNISCVSERSYRYIQSYYLIPAVDTVWSTWQRRALEDCEGRDVKLGGDARCSSPGHTAKYGSYSLMDLETGLILDTQLIQATEVTSSNAMELEGLKRGLQGQEHQTDLTTDRHVQVRKFMRTEQVNIRHWFDVWHVSKGVFRKLAALSKKKGCESIALWAHSISNHMYWAAASSDGDGPLVLEKWSSVANHVVNIHHGHGGRFPQCHHDELEGREWLLNGSKAHKELKDVVLSGRLLKDVQQLSPAEQTSQLESFHKLVCQFAPKFQHFFYGAMKARVLLAVLHNNENAGRMQAVKKDGSLKFKLSYPKAKQGDHVVKKVLEDCTYGYVEELLPTALERRDNFPSYKLARAEIEMAIRPASRALLANRIDAATAVEQHRTRFNYATLNSC